VKRFVVGSEARESKKNDGSQTRNRDSAEAREENGGGRTAAAQVELVRVYGLRERRERQGRAQRYREETRASRARLGEPSRAPRRRPHRASGRSIPFAGHHPVGARVLNRVRVDDAAREDASPFGEARETARKTPILLSSSLAGETRASRMARADARRAARLSLARKKIARARTVTWFMVQLV
jgi:hypothetical protein